MCGILGYILQDMIRGRTVRCNSLGWHCHMIHCVGKHMEKFVVYVSESSVWVFCFVYQFMFSGCYSWKSERRFIYFLRHSSITLSGVFEESFHSFRQCSFPASQKTLVSQRIKFSEGETKDQLWLANRTCSRRVPTWSDIKAA